MNVFNHLSLMASCCVLFWMRCGSKLKQNSIQNFERLAKICNYFLYLINTDNIVNKCLVKKNKNYESFWQLLNLSPHESFESHIRPKSDLFPPLSKNTIWVLKVSKTHSTLTLVLNPGGEFWPQSETIRRPNMENPSGLYSQLRQIHLDLISHSSEYDDSSQAILVR